MPTDRRVVAGGHVLAVDMVTTGSVTWSALAMLVVGLALAVGGLAILTGRGGHRSEPPSKGRPRSGPATPAPPLAAWSRTRPPTRATRSLASPEPVFEQGRDAYVAPPPPARATRAGQGEITSDAAGGACDWELRVDVSDGDPVVVRPAVGRPCCVHVLHVRSLDALPGPRAGDSRAWTGNRTRIGPSRAVSDVRSESHRVHSQARGLDLAMDATLSRKVARPVVTTSEEARVHEQGHVTAEGLWAAHLARLRDANVVSDPDEGPARLQTATRYRTEVALRTTRACRTTGHHLDASAQVSIDLEGRVSPAGDTRLTLPNVAGWIEGDLAAAATEPIEVSPGTDVHPAPGIDGPSGLAVGAAPGSGELRAAFAGHAERSVVDGGIDLVVACAVVADLGLGEAIGHPAAEGRITVAVSHRVRLAVTPPAADGEADGSDGHDLGCTCAPAYEVDFGVGTGAAPQAPHARLHVDGRSFRLDVVTRPDGGQLPSWTVRADAGDDEA